MAKRRWFRWAVLAGVVVVILAVGGPFVYIHLIEGPAKPKLSLPSAAGSSKVTAPESGGISGTWSVASGSQVGYRVKEVLLGQSATAVGRTSSVSGAVHIDGTVVTSASFTVDMASVKSDQSQRNAQFDGRIMDVSTYPTATFKLAAPASFGPVPPVGHVVKVLATGWFTLRGDTRKVNLTLSAERLGADVDVLTDVRIVFAEWGISNPSVGGFVTTANVGTLEVLLHLSKAAAATTTTTSGSGGGTGGAPSQVTVPRTTVPPLTIPAG
jgi:polyisoprenoid-binding protein YceI